MLIYNITMVRKIILFLALLSLSSACSTTPGYTSVVQAMEEPDPPFQSGVNIVKPTYTPLPSPTFTATPTPTSTITPTSSPTPAVFSEQDFVIIEDLAPSNGYDATTAYDSPPSYGGTKYILVDISEQHMYAYEGNVLVYSFVASTGMQNSTRVGTFSVLNKIPNAYGETWNIWMPNWLGIYWSGHLQNGIHALPILPGGGTLWGGYLGTPISYGCVVLGTFDAQALYNWADIGTPVEIRW
jgi:lipoprotein-anchoring transpeptidase ErfK/SrfK